MQGSEEKSALERSATVGEALEFFSRHGVTPRAVRRHLESLTGPPFQCILDDETIELDQETRLKIITKLEDHAGLGAL